MNNLANNPLIDDPTPESNHRTRGKEIPVIPSSTNGEKWTWKHVDTDWFGKPLFIFALALPFISAIVMGIINLIAPEVFM